MREAARSFTEPPGLAHSAFANISIPGNCEEIFSKRSSGVLPMRSSRVSPNADAAFAAVLKLVGTKLVNGRFAEPGILCESVHSVVYARAVTAGNATSRFRIRLHSLRGLCHDKFKSAASTTPFSGCAITASTSWKHRG